MDLPGPPEEDQAIADARRSFILRAFPNTPDPESATEVDEEELRELSAQADADVTREMFRDRLREVWDAKWPGEDWAATQRERYWGADAGYLGPRDRLQALEDMPEGLDPASYLSGIELEVEAVPAVAEDFFRRLNDEAVTLPRDWAAVSRRPVDAVRLARRLNLSPDQVAYQRARYERALGRLVARRQGRTSRRRTVLEARYSALVILQRRLDAEHA